MRIAPSTGTGTSMAALGLRLPSVIGTTFRDLRMAHPRLIYRVGIQSFPSRVFWWFPETENKHGTCIVVCTERWMEWPRKYRRSGGVGQDAIPSHNRRLQYGDPDGQWTASEC